MNLMGNFTSDSGGASRGVRVKDKGLSSRTLKTLGTQTYLHGTVYE